MRLIQEVVIKNEVSFSRDPFHNRRRHDGIRGWSISDHFRLSWQYVSALLEVNEGHDSTCKNNSGDHVLQIPDANGQPVRISTDGPVLCYRRNEDPTDPNNHNWTPWVAFSPDDQNTPTTIDVGLI
jgi:hypothetical protein